MEDKNLSRILQNTPAEKLQSKKKYLLRLIKTLVEVCSISKDEWIILINQIKKF